MTVITAFKAFDENLKCRDFQYEVGKEYQIEGRIEACDRGFHACENPWDVLRYYPITSRFAEVEMGGETDKRDDKIASSNILIKAEIGLAGWLKAAIAFTWEEVKPEAVKAEGELNSSGNSARIGSSGDYARSAAVGVGSSVDATGEGSIAAVLAPRGRAKASKGSWLVLSAHNDNGEVLQVKTAQAGVTKGVKADTWYELSTEGKFKEVA